MTERVESIDLGATWEPNAPDAVLLSRDDGTTVLALNPHPDDEDQRCVVFVWSGVRMASMSDPNDEAISGHRLYGKGLRGALWAAVVKDSELVHQIAKINQVHPHHDARRFADLVHHILLLKECTVETVATAFRLDRVAGPPARAALVSLAR